MNQGQVTGVEERTSKSGSKYLRVSIAAGGVETGYNIMPFKKGVYSVVKGLNSGDVVSYSDEPQQSNPQYKELTAINKISSGAPPTVVSASIKRTATGYDSPDAIMARRANTIIASATDLAAACITAGVALKDMDVDGIISIVTTIVDSAEKATNIPKEEVTA